MSISAIADLNDTMRSRAIPSDIKRVVRKQCGFGCVICGNPLFHYDHIEEFSNGGEHCVDNLTLLCPTHHDAKTRGSLAKKVIIKARKNPINLNKKNTSPHRLHILEDDVQVKIGDWIFIFNFLEGQNYFPAITNGPNRDIVLGVGREDEFALIDLVLSIADGSTALEIRKSEIIVATGNWDFEFVGSILKIRSGIRKIELIIEIKENGIDVKKAIIPCPPINLIVEQDHVTISDTGISFGSGLRLTRPYGLRINDRKQIIINSNEATCNSNNIHSSLDEFRNKEYNNNTTLEMNDNIILPVLSIEPEIDHHYFVVKCTDCLAHFPIICEDPWKGEKNVNFKGGGYLARCKSCGTVNYFPSEVVFRYKWSRDDTLSSWLSVSIT